MDEDLLRGEARVRGRNGLPQQAKACCHPALSPKVLACVQKCRGEERETRFGHAGLTGHEVYSDVPNGQAWT